MKCWHVPDKPETVKTLLSLFKGIAWLDGSALKKNACIRDAPTAIANLVPASEKDHATTGELKRQMEHKRYSPPTMNTCTGCLLIIIRLLKPKDIV
jgi:hypothetical protein